jgi:hypothetical protein
MLSVRVKRLIRDAATGAYLRADGRWTAHYWEARDFPDTMSIVEAVDQLGRAGLEEVVVLGTAPSEGDATLHRS